MKEILTHVYSFNTFYGRHIRPHTVEIDVCQYFAYLSAWLQYVHRQLTCPWGQLRPACGLTFESLEKEVIDSMGLERPGAVRSFLICFAACMQRESLL
jgi:hypothetical protein